MRNFNRILLYRKSAFTFAELMVSLVIIAVITVILYPTISDLAPNNNRYLFKSAYKTVEAIVSEITASGAVPTTANLMCKAFESRLNVVNTSGGSVCDNPDNPNTFQTTNGIRWAFEGGVFGAGIGCAVPNPCNIRVWFDVNASNNNMDNSIANGVNGDTDPNIPESNPNLTAAWGNGAAEKGIFYNKATGAAGTNVTQDTFFVLIRNDGKIIVPDNVAREHLLNSD